MVSASLLAIVNIMVFLSCVSAIVADGVSPGIVRTAAPSNAGIQITLIADDFFRPLYATHSGDKSRRLFVVEQSGKIWIVMDGQRWEDPFLDISHKISPVALTEKYSEKGLLTLAFHPDFAKNGSLFVLYTDFADADTVLERYQVSADNPNAVDPNSGEMLLHVWQPDGVHNGGHLAFGPDGHLYMSLGDGGPNGDPLGAGQNRQMLLGSILRIDVDEAGAYAIPADNPFVGDPAARDEIWSYGLRNVWRFSFDRLTGDMYLADVGFKRWEEVNFQPAASRGGENYGWSIWEGNQAFAGGEALNYMPPFFVYGHDQGCSVTGGYVYRGQAIPDLQAVYLFGDYCSGRIWASWRDKNLAWHTAEFMRTDLQISSFGQDEAGELYVVDYGGAIYRFDPAAA